MKYLIIFSVLLLVSPAFAQSPFRDTAGLTKNGIEWCEENYQLYKMIGNDFFEHHQHSIESRLCGNLYNDELWTYSEYDRYQKLIEQSRIYYHLEIQESTEEAKEGKIDTKPINIKEIPQEIAQQQKEIAKAVELQVIEKQDAVCDPGAIYQDGICIINPKLDPIATPDNDNDEELVYKVVLSAVIIGSIVGWVYARRKKSFKFFNRSKILKK